MTDPESIAAAIARTTRTFGRLDGWVNNAGILRMDAALDVPSSDWEAQMRVNVSGLFSCCQIVARQLVAQGDGGAIVNVASNAGKVGYPNMAGYNASKAAVINLTARWPRAWAHRVGIAGVPGRG